MVPARSTTKDGRHTSRGWVASWEMSTFRSTHRKMSPCTLTLQLAMVRGHVCLKVQRARPGSMGRNVRTPGEPQAHSDNSGQPKADVAKMLHASYFNACFSH